jgi:plasmid replication initiation protein
MKAEDIIIKESSIIKKSNMLARAAWSPDSIWESRLVAIVAAQVHKDDKDFTMYRVPITELLAGANVTNTGRVYKTLDELTDKAMTRLIKIKEGRSWVKYTLFSKCQFIEGEGSLLVRFDPDLKPHYLGLKRHFTTYSIAEFMALPSVYSQRIYEMLRSWDECISTNISISDLQESLCAPASMRKNFGEFRRRVLDKAHKDIHKFTKLKYEWEPVKKGRKVVAVRFVMGKQSMKKAQDKARASSVKSSLRYDSQDRKRNNDQATSLLAAVQCAADGCPGRGSQPFCKACMEGK